MESLDKKVLRILYDYYIANPGDAQMLITDLYARLADIEPYQDIKTAQIPHPDHHRPEPLAGVSPGFCLCVA